MHWKFDRVYSPKPQPADHGRPVRYQMPPLPGLPSHTQGVLLFIHRTQGLQSRALDDGSDVFIDTSRTSISL